MSNTRKVRRARKSRDRMQKERDEALICAKIAKENHKRTAEAFDKFYAEWQYHSEFMKNIVPDKHSAAFPPIYGGEINSMQAERGYRYAHSSLSLSETKAIEEMRTIRARISSNREFYTENLTHYIHLFHSHKEQQVYAYSSEMQDAVSQKGIAHRILDELIAYAKNEFFKGKPT